MRTDTAPVDINRQQGSSEDFEKDWRDALSGDFQRVLIYPSEKPEKQFDFFDNIKSQVVSEILEKAGSKGCVLEYGSGAAGMSIYLANQGFHSIACDLSYNALRLAGINARDHLMAPGQKYLFRVQGDTFVLPFHDNAFDVVMSYGLLEHFNQENLEQVMAEVLRVLRPGGLFVADIAHGRFSVRKIGIWINLIASLIFHFVTLRWKRLKELPALYLQHYYENDLDEKHWVAIAQSAGLMGVNFRVLHPFPALALSGQLERLYISFLQWAHPAWQWFHHAQPAWGRNWGWLYLIWGVKSVK